MLRRLPLKTDYTLSRDSAFAYDCHACKRCCHKKSIPLNPYEVARIAAHLELSTTEVLARYTHSGGAILRQNDGDDACVFLTEQGCGVHAARPLACRLYPLGRHLAPSGEERFAEVVPEPGSEGVYGGAGTVDDFLRAQGVAPYVAAADRYVELFKRMLATLARRPDVVDAAEAAANAGQGGSTPDEDTLLDVDAVVAKRCRERGITPPSDVDEKVRVHVAAIEEMLDAQ